MKAASSDDLHFSFEDRDFYFLNDITVLCGKSISFQTLSTGKNCSERKHGD